MPRPRTERLTRGLKIVRDQLIEAVQNCPPEEFDWKPRPGMKSVKDMLRECGGIEKVLLEYAKTGEQLDYQKIVKWSGEDLGTTLADLEKIREESLKFIGTLDEHDLDETRKNRRGEDTEVEEFLRSIYIHEYYHVGQIIYNRWMLGHNPYEKKTS